MSYYKNIPATVKEGDRFVVKYDKHMNGESVDFDDHTSAYYNIKLGDILELRYNDGSTCPSFWLPDKSDYFYYDWGIFEPLSKPLSESLSIDLQVGDVIQFVDNNGDLCRDSISHISKNCNHPDDELYKFINANGNYEIPVNKGVIQAISGKYAMVSWKCDKSRTPCVRFHIRNLKRKNRNNDVRTTINPESERSGTTACRVFCGKSTDTIAVGHPSYQAGYQRSTTKGAYCKVRPTIQLPKHY